MVFIGRFYSNSKNRFHPNLLRQTNRLGIDVYGSYRSIIFGVQILINAKRILLYLLCNIGRNQAKELTNYASGRDICIRWWYIICFSHRHYFMHLYHWHRDRRLSVEVLSGWRSDVAERAYIATRVKNIL